MPMRKRSPVPSLSPPQARAVLEAVQAAAAAADPLDPAPPALISSFHHAVRTVVCREDLPRYRLDGLHGLNMGYLHRRVGAILGEFDALVTHAPAPRRRTAAERAQG